MPSSRDLTIRIARVSHDQLGTIVRDTIALTEIPAPTGGEARRARRVQDLLRQDDPGRLVYIDRVGNVVFRMAGCDRTRSVLVAAHLDTVFDASTPVRAFRDGTELHGPGIGDNAVALASLVRLPHAILAAAGRPPACDVLLAFTVGEEGLGNLRGITGVLDLNPEIEAVIAVEGHGLGRVTNVAVGSRRLAVTVSGPGGHSWADAGRRSAVHVAASIIHELVSMDLPVWPRATVNIGQIHGGTGVTTIAGEATFDVDVRSTDDRVLDGLLERVDRIVRQARGGGISTSIRLDGARPAGCVPAESEIVRRARSVLSELNVRSELAAASTDANAAMARGIPAVCIGLTTGRDAHTTRERIAIQPLIVGFQQLIHLSLLLADGVADGTLRSCGRSTERQPGNEWGAEEDVAPASGQ